MGYTHYYNVNNWDSPEWRAAWRQLIEDVPEIIQEAGVPLTGMYTPEDIITPVLVDLERGIGLNGIGDDGHETFRLCKPGEWSFCKTARKPYDIVVSCIILRAWKLAPLHIGVGSDGDYDDWEPARALYAKLWPGEDVEGLWPKRDDGERAETGEGDEGDNE
ncbi:hypothetical protein N7522_001757 [Penicillium canescens]|uniref:Uncharacterized protein n=1 Tax=Penicillium canescens TaxID=5083 RepID=A0AAD6IRN0_PENCN|nr:uncharacterized protein N7446_008630 [Penicillium canescens]KAJ6019690.1 hypothetical protein N7522_001757 [Penicillium canescens]KAJ6033074.1 hypothetical protein N7444_010845 [Penicillium canescens]KAJ6057734.1 hypothetical protein N7460_001008 [Penicillium canescens]KAJ6059047.1 hypothetical protein N7446_008630 [Penicillium canescens]